MFSSLSFSNFPPMWLFFTIYLCLRNMRMCVSALWLCTVSRESMMRNEGAVCHLSCSTLFTVLTAHAPQTYLLSLNLFLLIQMVRSLRVRLVPSGRNNMQVPVISRELRRLLLITTGICGSVGLCFISPHRAGMEDVSISYQPQLEVFSESIKSILTFHLK